MDRIPISEVQAAAAAADAASKVVGKYIMINPDPESIDEQMETYIKRNELDTTSVGHIAKMDRWMYLIRWIDESDKIRERLMPKNLLENTNNFILFDATRIQEDIKQKLDEGESLARPRRISSKFKPVDEYKPVIDAEIPVLEDLMKKMDLAAMQRKSRTSVKQGGKKSRKNRKSVKVCKSRKLYKKFCKSRKLRKSRNVRKTRRR
jgi:hypothetical protein